jgi:hypothetical protein
MPFPPTSFNPITSANTDPTRVSPVMFTIVLSEVCETFAADAVSPYQF